jgi:hypothetical protein
VAADDWQRQSTGFQQPRGISSALVPTEASAGEILNMVLTEDGTLRSAQPPCEYHPATYGEGGPADTNYSKPHDGIFHAVVDGKDILLAHFNGGIYVHEGWVPQWRLLIGAAGSGAEIETAFPSAGNRAKWNTQFCFVGGYIVIVPQGGRAYAYNGRLLMPLGYEGLPSTPSANGPNTAPTRAWTTAASTATYAGLVEYANGRGYSHDGRRMPQCFGPNRIGSIDTTPPGYATGSGGTNATNKNGGALEPGAWHYAVQFIDAFGNVSAPSPQTAAVTVSRTDNWDPDNSTGYGNEAADNLRLQFACGAIPTGRAGTVGRILLRTKDQAGSGIPGLFEVPANVGPGGLAYATLQDNLITFFPDNVPDTALVKRAEDVDPVPLFRLCTMAYGRMWIANWDGGRTSVRPSMPGRAGTFPSDMVYEIDPVAEEVTGLHATRAGLLCFTESSTAIITPTDGSGDMFIRRTLSTKQGCVAPDSIATLPNGLTVWLGREGFYAFDGERIRLISEDVRTEIIRYINFAHASNSVAAVTARGEYRCWVPFEGGQFPTRGIVIDGTLDIRLLDYAEVNAVCVTKDYRQYMLALGRVYTGGGGALSPSVWVLDHSTASASLAVDQPTAVFETAWLTAGNSERRKSARSLKLLVRATGDFTPTVRVMRDWREYPKYDQIEDVPDFIPGEDIPVMWSVTELGDKARRQYDNVHDDKRWTRRRLYWIALDAFVPECEVYKVRIEFAGDMEIVGFKGYHVDSHHGGISHSRSGS